MARGLRKRLADVLSREDVETLRKTIVGELAQRPPTIGVIGISGVGKSSTINTLFRAQLPTSATVACTKRFWDVDIDVDLTAERLREVAPSVEQHLDGWSAHLRVVDAPGLGEDAAKDAEYLAAYRDNLGRCDVVLWVMTARNRAIALDQHYLQELREFHERMVFAVNQADLVDPLNWHPVLNLPSPEQEQNLATIIEDRREKINAVIGRDPTIVAYSAKARYNLEPLFTTLLSASSEERRWLFALLKGFRWDDFLTVEAREELERWPAGS
jgi:predicted GTPase